MSNQKNHILYIHEFPASDKEWMSQDLLDAIRSEKMGEQVFMFHGFLKEYRHGGSHPIRILTLSIWRFCCHLLFFSIVLILVIVRTSPPLLHYLGRCFVQVNECAFGFVVDGLSSHC